MIISYVPFQRWYKKVVAQPESLYSRKNQKRIKSTISRIDEYKIHHEFTKLDQVFLSWFTPIYEKTISEKDNAVVHDLYQATLGNENKISEYWSLTIFQDNKPLGASIIGIREERIMIAFKVFEPKWTNGTLQATPSLYADHLASQYAYDLNKKFISHGKDRNPYGINAAIGLATYKLSIGYTPILLDDKEIHEPINIDTDTIHCDALILHYPKSGDKITEATLVTKKETAEKYIQITRYPDLLSVNTVYNG